MEVIKGSPLQPITMHSVDTDAGTSMDFVMTVATFRIIYGVRDCGFGMDLLMGSYDDGADVQVSQVCYFRHNFVLYIHTQFWYICFMCVYSVFMPPPPPPPTKIFIGFLPCTVKLHNKHIHRLKQKYIYFKKNSENSYI